MADAASGTDLPPYLPFSTFVTVLDRLESGGIPLRIDRGYWGQHLAGGVGVQLMAGLRYLGLINTSAEPQPELEMLVAQDTRKPTLAGILQARYIPIFSEADPSRATRGHLEKAFKDSYSVDGDTRRKAVSFFLKAAEYAGLPLSNHMRTRGTPVRSRTGRTRTAATPSGSSAANGRASKQRAVPTTAAPASGNLATIDLGEGNRISLGLQLNLVALTPELRARVFTVVDSFQALRDSVAAPME